MDSLVRKLDYAKVFSHLVQATKDFVQKSGFSQVLLGMSGGLDSALVAVIAKEALGSDKVLAVLLPSEYTSQSSFDDAYALIKNLAIASYTVSITPIFEQTKASLAPVFAKQKIGGTYDNTEENMQSRIRGLLLMSISNKFKSLVLNTSNKSEINTGYSTLYGDSCGALSVLGSLYKTEVFALAEWYNLAKKSELIPKNILTKAPSAELRPNQKDADSLPDYPILDPILEKILTQQNLEDNPLNQRILQLYKSSLFKQAQFPPILDLA